MCRSVCGVTRFLIFARLAASLTMFLTVTACSGRLPSSPGNNQVVGLNLVGLRRSASLTDDDRRQIKQAFTLTYRSGLPASKALAEMDACGGWGPAAVKFREFVRRVLAAEKPHNRGLCPAVREKVNA